jgi:hypothetical protein
VRRHSRSEIYKDYEPEPPRPTTLIYLLVVISSLAFPFGVALLLGSHFLPKTRLLLGGVYLLIGTNAASGAALLMRLRR